MAVHFASKCKSNVFEIAMIGRGDDRCPTRFYQIEQGSCVIAWCIHMLDNFKQAVAALKAKSVPQAETLPRDYRPWGWYESLVVGPRFQVKRIVVYRRRCPVSDKACRPVY